MTKSKPTTFDIALIILLAVLIIAFPVLYLVVPNMMNVLSTSLFQLLNLILSVYISFRFSSISAMNKTIDIQKNIAKTAVRHIRTYGQYIQTLIFNIGDKMSSSKYNKLNSCFKDIRDHLTNISIGINSSEIDFKDILGEELKEENIRISELTNDMRILESKLSEVDKMRKLKERANKEQLNALSEEINNLRSKISENYNNLPIGSSINFPLKGGVSHSLGYAQLPLVGQPPTWIRNINSIHSLPIRSSSDIGTINEIEPDAKIKK